MFCFLIGTTTLNSGSSNSVPVSSGVNTAPTSGPGGMMFPPGDFLQNMIQMATNAALQGQQPGRQGFNNQCLYYLSVRLYPIR
jgi:hypothetical protein